MTRAERIEQYLITSAGLFGPSIQEMTPVILAIADDRQLLSLKDVATMIGRPGPTILSWYQRGRQHGFPASAYTTGTGMVWDAEDVQSWAVTHPQLCGPTAVRANAKRVDA